MKMLLFLSLVVFGAVNETKADQSSATDPSLQSGLTSLADLIEMGSAANTTGYPATVSAFTTGSVSGINALNERMSTCGTMQPGPVPTAAPEPSALSLVFMAAMGALRHRGRRRMRSGSF